MSTITAIILARNEEKHIVDCIKSIQFADEILVIEFISDTKFQEYMADLNGNVMSTGVDSGAYTYSDDVIQFSNQTSTSPFKSATVNGNVLEMTYQSGFKRTFMKK